MGFNARLHPQTAGCTPSFGSVATDGSEIQTLFAAERAGQVLGAIFWNGTANSVASGTTAGSAVNVYVYKTASAAGSRVASARLAAVATLATQALTLSTATGLTRFSEGNVYLSEVVGGAGMTTDGNTLGSKIILRYMYAEATDDDATP